jgi:hypothetical protein
MSVTSIALIGENIEDTAQMSPFFNIVVRGSGLKLGLNPQRIFVSEKLVHIPSPFSIELLSR